MKHTVESYLAELEVRLSPLPEEKRKEIIREYRSHFEAAGAEGVPEGKSLAALKNPIRLSDSILRAHGVFTHAEKWQVRWLGFYCLVLTILISFAVQNMTEVGTKLQAIPLYLFLATMWGLGCLPYYISCFQSRRFLWKPFLGASAFVLALFWGNFAFRSFVIHQQVESSYVQGELKRAQPKELKEFAEAIEKFAGYGSGSGMGHFSWYYEVMRPALNRGAHLVVSQPEFGGFLVPDSSPDRNQAVRFRFVADAHQAARAWGENKDRLSTFAGNAGVISRGKAANEWPVQLLHIKHLPSLLRYVSPILFPLGIIALLSSSIRPLVRRPRGLA